MTVPVIDFSALTPEPLGEGIPDYRASSGESGDHSPSSESPRVERQSSFLGRKKTAAPRTRRQSVPKLPVGAKKQIEKLYTLIGGFIKPFDDAIGQEIMDSAPVCAESVYELAQQNEAFRAALAGLMTSSLTGAVIFAHLPILLAVTARVAKNDKVKTTAVAGYMGLKLAGNVPDMPNLWDTDTDAE